jgi:hypothetical protein
MLESHTQRGQLLMKPVISAGLSALLALSGVSGAVVSAAWAGGGSYDGRWAVQLVTLRGNCDRSLQWDVGVAASRIAENGALGQATGAVDSHGRVRLQLVNAQDRVSASGKLNGATGAGAWNSPTRACSGQWHAEKRA